MNETTINNPHQLTEQDIQTIWRFIVGDISHEISAWMENNFDRLSTIIDIELCCNLLNAQTHEYSIYSKQLFKLMQSIELPCLCLTFPQYMVFSDCDLIDTNTVFYHFISHLTKQSITINNLQIPKAINIGCCPVCHQYYIYDDETFHDDHAPSGILLLKIPNPNDSSVFNSPHNFFAWYGMSFSDREALLKTLPLNIFYEFPRCIDRPEHPTNVNVSKAFIQQYGTK